MLVAVLFAISEQHFERSVQHDDFMQIFAAPLCFATAYIQWFILFPRLVTFIRQTFFRRDIQIHLTATVASIKTLSDAAPDVPVQDWQKSWYDAQKRTPVERIFEKDEDPD